MHQPVDHLLYQALLIDELLLWVDLWLNLLQIPVHHSVFLQLLLFLSCSTDDNVKTNKQTKKANAMGGTVKIQKPYPPPLCAGEAPAGWRCACTRRTTGGGTAWTERCAPSGRSHPPCGHWRDHWLHLEHCCLETGALMKYKVVLPHTPPPPPVLMGSVSSPSSCCSSSSTSSSCSRLISGVSTRMIDLLRRRKASFTCLGCTWSCREKNVRQKGDAGNVPGVSFEWRPYLIAAVHARHGFRKANHALQLPNGYPPGRLGDASSAVSLAEALVLLHNELLRLFGDLEKEGTHSKN